MEKENKKTYRVKVSVNFYRIMEKQKKKVVEATYNCVNPDWAEISDILAKKIIEADIV